MITLITGSLILSVLHALIPSHWLPVIAIGKRENWSHSKTMSITLLSGLAHALSTVIIGVAIGIAGQRLTQEVTFFAAYVAPTILVLLGGYYIYQHNRHRHFHLHSQPDAVKSTGVVWSLTLAMFLSPCLEIEAYFLLAGARGWATVAIVATLYTTVTVTGMLVWVGLIYKGLSKLNWHAVEHYSGIITGVTLLVTGIITYFIS